MSKDAERRAGVARMFDRLADVYDQEGVPFFGPIAARLVELLAPRPGERAVDVGCGRGAVTIALCTAVAPAGHVIGVDISARMVAELRDEAARLGLTNLELLVGDSADVGLEPGGFDLVSASLVLFFTPDPVATLRHWISLLRPTGRIGITTFGDRDRLWRDVDDLFTPHLPPGMLDPRTTHRESPFASTTRLETLFADCGASGARSTVERIELEFADASAWRAWTMTTGQAGMWAAVPEAERDELFAAATGLLEGARATDGVIRLGQDVRYTTATAI